MPSRVFRKLHASRLARWFEDSKPMTRREFYALFTVLFLMITASLLGLKQLSDGRVKERRLADYRGCVFVREHIVKPDRQTVLTGPYKAVPTLRSLGFTAKEIEGYLSSQYGGVNPALLEAPPPDGLGLDRARAEKLTGAKSDGVAAELARRPIPVCENPAAPKPPGKPEAK